MEPRKSTGASTPSAVQASSTGRTLPGGITKHESDFKQDLNGDGTIGIESASLVAVSTDKVGARLKRDSENALYIDVNNDGTNIIAITDEWGGTPTFDYSSSWTDGSNTDSWSQESVAVEAQSNGSQARC